MNNKDLEYIFLNINTSTMNIYKKIPTLNTMKQYVNKTKKCGFKFDEGIGKGNQKTLTLKRLDETIIGEVKDMKYPNNSQESLEFVRDKITTEKLLILSGINTTNSKVYNENEMDQAKSDFYNEKNKLAVIKPTNMSQGKGVNVGINEFDFEYYWLDTISQIKVAGRKNVNVILQDYIEGFEARAVVIEGKLISIVARVPAYVVGNGKDTISSLVNQKNNKRKRCAHLMKRPIELDKKKINFIENYGMDIASVPEKGQYILLSSISNISNGGEMIDITDAVSDEIKSIAINSVAAIPGMYSGGVDIMMKDFEDANPRIIEINAWPMLQSTIYPTYGKAYDPQGYFLNSFYAMDQFINKPEQLYNIDNKDTYIRNFMKFQNLKIRLQGLQITNSLNL